MTGFSRPIQFEGLTFVRMGWAGTKFNVYKGSDYVAKFEVDPWEKIMSNIEVLPRFRRQGIASIIYRFVEKDFKFKLKPSSAQTNDSKAFWKARMNEENQSKQLREIVPLNEGLMRKWVEVFDRNKYKITLGAGGAAAGAAKGGLLGGIMGGIGGAMAGQPIDRIRDIVRKAKKKAKEKSLNEGSKLLDKRTLSPRMVARKHGVSKNQILNQLRKGVGVEKEHTSHLDTAREIALDHLGEIPDYYTRLKEMEKNA